MYRDVEVVHLDSQNVGLVDDRIIQDDSDIMPHLHTELARAANVATEERPLLLLRVTIAHEQTAVGVSWHHTLGTIPRFECSYDRSRLKHRNATIGDAATLLRFMQTLSHAYQEISLPKPPTLVKHAFPTPSQELVERYKAAIPHLAQTYHQSELAAQYAGMNRDVARVDVRIAGLFLDRLANRVREQTGEARVSRQDCLTAYVATVLNQCGAGPIDTVTNAASVGSVPQPESAMLIWMHALVSQRRCTVCES